MAPRTPAPPHGARRPSPSSALVVLAIALISGAAVVVLVVALTAPQSATLVAWFGGSAALLFACALAAFSHQRSVAAANAAHADAVLAEATDLVDRLTPDVVGRLRGGASAESALAQVEQPENADHRRLLRVLAEEIGHGERMRAATMAACANAAGRVQALTTSMLADLREMEEQHGEDVLGDLLKLDHSTAQAGRLADSIAVLTGARSGRRWTKPIVMESVLRGAIGRVSAYQRVRTHSVSSVAVVGYAAEGVMHALAELIDNATSFSPPSEQVHVYVEEVHAGVVVTIEDGGLVMGDLALRRAEQAVSAQALDLTALSGTRLGLAVVGALARKHGLRVSFRPSSRGGTGVVVMIPRTLITEARKTPAASRRRVEREPALAAAPAALPAALPAAPERSADRSSDGPPEPPAPRRRRPPAESADRFDPTAWESRRFETPQRFEASWRPAEPPEDERADDDRYGSRSGDIRPAELTSLIGSGGQFEPAQLLGTGERFTPPALDPRDPGQRDPDLRDPDPRDLGQRDLDQRPDHHDPEPPHPEARWSHDAVASAREDDVDPVAEEDAVPEEPTAPPVLPRRKRGSTLAPASDRPARPAAKPAGAARPDLGSRFGAFRDASRGKRPADDPLWPS
ncbi:sensor histidine kinase [Actinosynnema mirum]|uniref:histidine kinase n=1 Tax=Actinosynnema mirum (strain ATCC 29888 / DSM 43827 / JCM 3225 / NBRC 14064 / NCIMB 13271 / NRRL B-12336 / IMRU 3971 / 101) TaxID=446462 RepID=C6WPE1_ACTMD|nr:ATP-binding region ATPase domain protein [Actinosynnema mirum DSM 43827]AXX32243.1 putative sensor-like histidine kinase [Actinosynnema pretiosum subsp. pretiosum]